MGKNFAVILDLLVRALSFIYFVVLHQTQLIDKRIDHIWRV